MIVYDQTNNTVNETTLKPFILQTFHSGKAYAVVLSKGAQMHQRRQKNPPFNFSRILLVRARTPG